MVFDWFGFLIFFVAFLLLSFAIKVYLDSNFIKKNGDNGYALLIKKYHLEQNRNQLNSEKVKIAEYFTDSILERLLNITKELILFQKLIFEKL
ncbi:hypothetical protein [Algibacter sp. R77976]|uniref:hypothetical protein n=1 Tax=Algibacter sp. R77976 TaxID=3093873 RepID=UPI0037C59B5A